MTTYSKADLRNSALQDLKVLDPGESLSGSDSETADAEMQRLFEYLEDENLVIFDLSAASDTDVIPGRVFHALRDLLAETLAPSYGIERRTVVGPTGPQSLYENALRRLRRSVFDGSDDVPVKVCYF